MRLLKIAAAAVVSVLIVVGLQHEDWLKPKSHEVQIGMPFWEFYDECHMDAGHWMHIHTGQTEEGSFADIRLLSERNRPQECTGDFSFRNEKLISIAR